MMERRAYGTGRLWTRRGKGGRETWYASWRQGTRRVQRKLGLKRQPGSREGLTQTQAEAKLRELMNEGVVVAGERTTIKQIGDRYIHHLEFVMERKRTTIQDYKIILNRHFAPFFGTRAVDRIDADDVMGYLIAKRRAGLATKTIQNHLTFLHGIFKWAIKKRVAAVNPVEQVDRPKKTKPANPRLQFLTPDQLDLLLRHVPDDPMGRVETVLYLAAALTGIRQGELLGLRWRDLGWSIFQVRVADQFTRGEFDHVKSDDSRRAVPMADRLADALELHHQRSAFTADDHLVFGHPELGTPLDPSKLRKRFYKALDRAGLHRITFHELRHTFGTQMAAVGAPMRSIQEWYGHADQKTTEIYTHYAPDKTGGKAFAEQAFGRTGPEADRLAREDDADGQTEPGTDGPPDRPAADRGE